MNATQVLSIVRNLVGAFGGGLVAAGIVTPQAVNGVTAASNTGETIVGLATMAASMGWGIYTHTRANTVARAQAMQAVPVATK